MQVESFLEVAALKFGLTLNGPVKFGFDKRSAGCACLRGEELFWLKIKNLKKAFSRESSIWNGEVDSQAIQGVMKPALLDFKDWEDEDYYWRATISNLVHEEICSETPYLKNQLLIDPSYFLNLKKSLQVLSSVSTPRYSIRQDLMDRRLKDFFGPEFDSKIDNWVTCHGDLHWANLTKQTPILLDWEAWGKGPKGLDPAILMAFSVDQPLLLASIEKVFAEDLSCSDGFKAQLFILIELARMCDLHGRLFHPEFERFQKCLLERIKIVQKRFELQTPKFS